MSSNKTVAEWYFNDLLGHKGKLPNPTFGIFFLKSLMDVIAADGVITDPERKWVIGFAAISGYPDEVIEQLENYQPQSSKEGIQTIDVNMDRNYVKFSLPSMIYHAFQAAEADGELNAKEVEAICELAKKLGATNEQIQKVQDLYNDEIKLRKKRAATLVPKSLNTVLSELKKGSLKTFIKTDILLTHHFFITNVVFVDLNCHSNNNIKQDILY